MKAPTRLIDDPTAAAELRSDLERAAAVSPTYDVAAGLAGLQAAMTATSAATAASASATGTAAAKTASIAAAKSATVFGVLSVKAAVVTIVAAAAVVTTAIAWPSALPTRPAPPHTRVVPRAPAVVTPVPAAPAPPTPAPLVRDHATTTTTPATTDAARNPTRIQDAESRREIAQLARIKSVVDTDPALAYRLAQQGDREFARGMLRQEREALAIVALADSGRKPEAARRMRAFVARYPNSPARERLEQLLGAQRE